MAVPPIERVSYFTGEALLTSDFRTEQDYQMRALRYHNRDLHTWGIASGLAVQWLPLEALLLVSPGMALDALGREILLVNERVVPLGGRGTGIYYLTLTYDEIPTDYTVETGAAGYKRIVEDPKIELSKTYDEPEIHLLLAIVDLTAGGIIGRIYYADGQSQRRHCGILVGELGFRLGGEADPFAPQLSAQQDLITGERWLAVDSPWTRIDGLVTIDGSLGVGVDAPGADLEVQNLRYPGEGTISSADQVVTHDGGPFPASPEVGDMLVAVVVPGAAAQTREVIQILSAASLEVDAAFDPPLLAAAYSWHRAALAVMRDLGGSPILVVLADGNVGIDLANPAYALQVDGTVAATAFLGDGSGLKNVNSLWSQSPADPLNIYYADGLVGINLALPLYTLDVNGDIHFSGKLVGGGTTVEGDISCTTLEASTSVTVGTAPDTTTVTGTSITAASLTVSGQSTLGATGTGTLTADSLTVGQSPQAVTGAISAASLMLSGQSTSSTTVVTGALTADSLTVTGQSKLLGTTGTGALTADSLTVNGQSTLETTTTGQLTANGFLQANSGLGVNGFASATLQLSVPGSPDFNSLVIKGGSPQAALSWFETGDSNAIHATNDSDTYPTIYSANAGSGGTDVVVGARRYGLLSNARIASASGHAMLTHLPTKDGLLVLTSPLTREVEVYFSGRGSLAAGRATIPLDAAMKDLLASAESYKVLLTATADCKGLYVESATHDGFTVKETAGGAGGASFDWFLIGRRRRSLDAEDAEPMPQALPRVQAPVTEVIDGARVVRSSG